MKADIFFFVATISVIILAILGVIAAIYVVRILRDIKQMSGKLDQGMNAIKNSSLASMIFGKKTKKR